MSLEGLKGRMESGCWILRFTAYLSRAFISLHPLSSLPDYVDVKGRFMACKRNCRAPGGRPKFCGELTKSTNGPCPSAVDGRQVDFDSQRQRAKLPRGISEGNTIQMFRSQASTPRTANNASRYVPSNSAPSSPQTAPSFADYSDLELKLKHDVFFPHFNSLLTN